MENENLALQVVVEEHMELYVIYIRKLWLSIAAILSILLVLARYLQEVSLARPKFTRHLAAKNLALLAVLAPVYFSVGYSLQNRAEGGFYGT